MEKKPVPTIHDLYPHFTDEQLAEAEDAHDRYLAICVLSFRWLAQCPTNHVIADFSVSIGAQCIPPTQDYAILRLNSNSTNAQDPKTSHTG